MMQHKTLIVCFLLAVNHSILASDFGTVGLIDIPTARMSKDGILTTSSAIQSRTNSYALTYQLTPWLEGTFRYSGNNDFFFWDRNYEAKLLLWSEQDFLPQVALGIRDMVGTGVFGAEYLVGTKAVGKFDLTMGIGWGRLAGERGFSNPLTLISSKFKTRTEIQGGMGTTGVFQPGQWFSGEKAGIFGGLMYSFDSLPLSLMLEYNPDQYNWERNYGNSLGRFVPEPKSPVSAALSWVLKPGFLITTSYQHNQEWGIGFSAKLDTKSPPPTPSPKLYKSSLDMSPINMPPGLNQSFWYDALLFDVERSGLLLLEATISNSKNTATIVMGNRFYPLWTDALEVMVNLLDLHLPITVSTFNIIVEEEGHRTNQISLRRPSLNYGKSPMLVEREVRVAPIKTPTFVQHKTNFFNKKIVFDVNLSNRVQLFDPDDPARYQLYAKIGISMMLPRNWVLSGAFDRNIINNFDESTRESNSVLQKVRSDVVKYLTEGETGLDSLFVQKRGNVKNDVFYRLFGGILESMYSGFGGEILFKPFQSRVAFGLSANWVKQRDFEKNLKHLNFETSTAFASIYWASPLYNFDFAVHVGKYLAKDLGATVEIRRTFDNGWMIGAWATKTDVSAEDFGEGSFDKGLFFKIPFNGLFGNSSRSSYTTRVRPVQRDGGQYLEDFSGKIWWDLRAVRYDVFSKSAGQILR